MKQTIEKTEPTARVVSGHGLDGRPILSLLCKRTHRIDDTGALSLAEEQVPLFDDLVPDPVNSELILFDSDLFPLKTLTDAIVVGHAYPPAPARSFDAGIAVGTHLKRLSVIGDRRCAISSTGSLVFSEPEVVEKVPLRYDRAYGGHDARAEEKQGDRGALLKDALPPEQAVRASEYAYPRNFYGRGYLIEGSREATEALLLPNLEDPADRLAPDRLVVGDVHRWPQMPLPWTLGVMDHGFFPRIGFAGCVPWFEPRGAAMAEVTRGFAPASMLSNDVSSPAEKIDFRFANSASLGLQLDGLRGDESILLHNLHPRRSRLSIRLPSTRPRLSLADRGGRLMKAEPVLHSVIVEPDEDRLTVVWRGAIDVRRPLLPEEIDKTPFLVEW